MVILSNIIGDAHENMNFFLLHKTFTQGQFFLPRTAMLTVDFIKSRFLSIPIHWCFINVQPSLLNVSLNAAVFMRQPSPSTENETSTGYFWPSVQCNSFGVGD